MSNEPFSYSLQLNLGPRSQLLEAVLPFLSCHHSDSVQIDISIYELFAVTSAQVASLTQSLAAATERERRSSARLAPSSSYASSYLQPDRCTSSVSLGSGSSGGPYLGGNNLQPTSRFSSTSTLDPRLLSTDSFTDNDAFTFTDHTRLASWLKGNKRSASLMHRVGRRLERVREKLSSGPKSREQANVPSRVMRLELDMDRWEQVYKSDQLEDIDQGKDCAVASWTSSISLGSELSFDDDTTQTRLGCEDRTDSLSRKTCASI